MTIRQRLEELLIERCLWPDEAKLILDIAATDARFENFVGRWNDNVTGYPLSVTVVLFMTIKILVVEWIDANKPLHFARPLFSDEEL